MNNKQSKNCLFRWQGIDSNNHSVKGVVTAYNQAEAIIQLRKKHIKVISIQRSITIPWSVNKRKIKPVEIALFTRQLSTFLTSGIPLIQSLKLIETQLNNSSFKPILINIIDNVEAGYPISMAMRQHKVLFNPLYTNLVSTGETTGQLDQIFERLADLLEKKQKLKEKMIRAMIYPFTVIFTGIIVAIILLTTIIPEFESLFRNVNAELPNFTQNTIILSRWLNNHIFTLIAILLGIVTITKYYLSRSNKAQLHCSYYLLKLPIIGSIVTKIALTSFSYALSLNLSAGIPILNGIKESSQSTQNRYYQYLFVSIFQELSSGMTLYSSLQRHAEFPDYFVQMIMVGEQSGTLEEMLIRVANHYEHDVDSVVDNLNTLLEPFIMIFLGILIGSLIISIYLPIFNLVSVMG